MKKKIIIIALITLIILTGLFVYYKYFIKKKTQEIDSQKIIIKTDQKVEKIIDKQISSPGLSQNNKTIYYYENESGKILKMEINDKKTQELAIYNNIEKIIWSPDKNQAIFSITYDKDKFIENQSPFYKMGASNGRKFFWAYNLQDKKLTELNNNIQNIIWNPQKPKIIYHYLDEEKNESFISSANSDGTNWEGMTKLNCYTCQILSVILPNEDVFFSEAETQNEDSLIFNVLKNKNKQIEKVLDNALDASISPNGEIIIAQNNDGAYLHKTKDRSKEKLNYSLNISKTIWSEDNKHIYAVIDQGENSSDFFLLINTDNGKITEYYFNEEEINIL